MKAYNESKQNDVVEVKYLSNNKGTD